MAGVTWTYDIKTDSDDSKYAEIYCDISHTTTTDLENADKYIFEVRRYKDVATKEEHLNVQVFDAVNNGNNVTKATNNVCAEIERANIIELESKLLNLRIYGVLLGRKHFPKVRQIIEKAYTDLTARVDKSNILPVSEVIEDIYKMFVHYIKDVGIISEKIGHDILFNIPVTEFKEYLADTKYSKYKYSDIREELAKFTKKINGKNVNGTKCSFGRKDNTIARGDKRIKMISFVQAVVDSYQIT